MTDLSLISLVSIDRCGKPRYRVKAGSRRWSTKPGVRVLINRSGTVADIPDDELLERAVHSALDRGKNKGVPHLRWVAVMDTFLLGSTYAAQLCQRFGLDPDEKVKR